MTTALTIYENKKPVELFTRDNVDGFIEAIEKEARSMVFDISTNKGRDELRSYAHKIAKTKTTLDKLGKSLTEEQRAEIDRVNKERKLFWDRLEALQHEIRKPLTEFEERETKRVHAHEDRIKKLQECGVFYDIPSLSDIDAALVLLQKTYGINNEWEEFKDRAESIYTKTLADLNKRREERIKYEAEQAELARLRKEKEERERLDREEALKKEAADMARREAEEKAAREKFEAESKAKAEKERLEREKQEAEARLLAAEKAKIEAEQKAEHDRIEAEKKAEREKMEAIEAEKRRAEAEKKAEQDEIAKREADKKHKAKIHNEIKAALQLVIDNGINGEDPVKDFVIAIASGKIPHVKILY